MLRWHLTDIAPTFEVATTTLKKFATERGNAKKELVLLRIAKRYDVEFDSNDEYDSFALFRAALLALGLTEPSVAFEAQAVKLIVTSIEKWRARSDGEQSNK